MKIEILDAIDSRIPRNCEQLITEFISWEAIYWKRGPFGRIQQPYLANAITRRGGGYSYFLTGLVPRIIKGLDRKGIEYELIGGENPLPHNSPNLPEIETFTEFRPDQIYLINKARRHIRGIIKSPTGTGKTLIQMGICSCYPQSTILIMAHTIDIVKQTVDELEKFGFEDIQEITGTSQIKIPVERIVVSTMQTFGKIMPNQYMDYFEVVIIDEAHHVRNTNSTYGKILRQMLAPIRLGFTATLPENKDELIAMEGLLGPVIGELTIQDAVEEKILAKPVIQLFKTEYNRSVHSEKRYADAYEKGIVQNRQRNEKIAEIVSYYVDQHKSILIMVTKIEHGGLLERFILDKGVSCKFVRGSTEGEERVAIKEALINKTVNCVIATVVWREGINIPTLDVVVNACGGKSEIMTLQAIGRGLRRTKDKDEVIIVDFFDNSHHYLISHFGERITLYMDNGWRFI